MAFERLKLRAPVSKQPLARSPATITLSCIGGSKRPATIIAMRADLVEQACFTATSKFDVMIGRGDDAGRVRLVESGQGIVQMRTFKRTNAHFVNLGFVPEIGEMPASRTETDARVVGTGIVEIDIPVFARDDDSGAVERTEIGPALEHEIEQEFADRAAAAPAPKPKPASLSARTNGKVGLCETFNGIGIDFAEDDEAVIYNGKRTEVTTRQAVLIKSLAVAKPGPVGENVLVKKIYGANTPKDATSLLRQMCADLERGLAPLGLSLRKVPGVGYQLRDA